MANTTWRFHSVTSTASVPNFGTHSCDFRGEKFIGAKEGDNHHTIEEIDTDESSPIIQDTLSLGPAFNAYLGNVWAEKTKGLPAEEAALIPHFRVGIWDKQAPY